MPYIKKFFDFILFGNIFVALGITSLAFQTFYFFNSKPDFYLLFFIFLCTLFVYSFHHFFGLKKRDSYSEVAAQLKWLKHNNKLMIFVLLICIPAILFCTLKLSFSHLAILIPLGLISFGYSLPVISGTEKNVGLRNIPGIKIFLISFVISCVTVLLPVISLKQNLIISDKKIIFLFLERIFFVFAITIPFDIRDMADDNKNEIKTIPIISGEKNAKILAFASLFFCAAAVIFDFYFFKMKFLTMTALLFSLAISAIFISKSSSEKSEYFFSFTVESLLIWQTLLVAISYFL